MDKRYQVFVSSTYADLKDERKSVMQTLMEMDCFPAGMELFPAADEEQWEFIKKVIQDSDYYLLIIGGRYGTMTAEGISYTEKEFDCAVELGLKVVALIHGEPEKLPFDKFETTPDVREKLEQFRNKVQTGRLVKFWQNATELSGQVALSLAQTLKRYPAVGWVRANLVANEELLLELNELRKASQNTTGTAQHAAEKIEFDEIADFDSMFEFRGKMAGNIFDSRAMPWTCSVSWRKLFSMIAPYLLEHPVTSEVTQVLTRSIKNEAIEFQEMGSFYMNDQEVQTIMVQLKAYGLINTEFNSSDKVLILSLTPKGEQYMFDTRIFK